MTKIAINGLGRMGKLVLRAFIDEGLNGDIVLVNDVVGTPEQHALFLEFDTVHGRWRRDFGWDDDHVIIDGTPIRRRPSSRSSRHTAKAASHARRRAPHARCATLESSHTRATFAIVPAALRTTARIARRRLCGASCAIDGL